MTGARKESFHPASARRTATKKSDPQAGTQPPPRKSPNFRSVAHAAPAPSGSYEFGRRDEDWHHGRRQHGRRVCPSSGDGGPRGFHGRAAVGRSPKRRRRRQGYSAPAGREHRVRAGG